MRKIIVKLSTGNCGETVHDAILVEDDLSNHQIDDWAYEMSRDHYESYGHDEDDFEFCADYTWWDYRGAEDDMHRMGGGSFEEDFND